MPVQWALLPVSWQAWQDVSAIFCTVDTSFPILRIDWVLLSMLESLPERRLPQLGLNRFSRESDRILCAISLKTNKRSSS
jgi:hypothetical protein